MDWILLVVQFALALATISLPRIRLRNVRRAKARTNITSRALHSPVMEVAAFKLAVLAILTALVAETLIRVLQAQVPWMIRMLPV